MKRFLLGSVLVAWLGAPAVPAATAQTDQHLAILDEKLDHLKAAVEDLQFKQQKLQQQFDDLEAQVQNLRRAGGGATAADAQALEARVKALEAAHEKDKQAILDTLAKELANLSPGHGTTPPPPPNGDAKFHVVQKKETLSSIAKDYGVSVEDLKKANNLTDTTIKIGQKLLLPK